MMTKTLITILVWSSGLLTSFAQTRIPEGGGAIDEMPDRNCLTEEHRREIRAYLDSNIKLIEKQQTGLIEPAPDGGQILSFGWPIRNKPELRYYNTVTINNYVDQDAGSGLLDYNCGIRTYNGHKGIDIDTWPFPWFLYDSSYVEVVAAEAGVIIGKTDGNDDDHCSFSGTWNAVYLQHSDGSESWYGHLKKNSLTTKAIGQSVAKGEYLGVVASSGYSTGPHLHLEIYDSTNKLVDPFAGSCNSMNSSSWWQTQQSYTVPTLNALLTHNAVPVHGCPGNNEIPNMSDLFYAGDLIYLAAYFRDQVHGDVVTWRMRKPDQSIWQSWNQTLSGNYSKSWWYYSRTLPDLGPYGNWKLELVFRGQTYVHEFEYAGFQHLAEESPDLRILLFPNPAQDIVNVEGVKAERIRLLSTLGQTLAISEGNHIRLEGYPRGLYWLLVEADGRTHMLRFEKH